jgi:hypothetical protein
MTGANLLPFPHFRCHFQSTAPVMFTSSAHILSTHTHPSVRLAVPARFRRPFPPTRTHLEAAWSGHAGGGDALGSPMGPAAASDGVGRAGGGGAGAGSGRGRRKRLARLVARLGGSAPWDVLPALSREPLGGGGGGDSLIPESDCTMTK